MPARKGMRFKHARVIRWEDKTPATYEVTRIARGLVYYRAVIDEGITGSERLGSPECCKVENFSKVCLSEISKLPA